MQVFAAPIASRLLPGFALGAINVEDVTSDEVRQYVVYSLELYLASSGFTKSRGTGSRFFGM